MPMALRTDEAFLALGSRDLRRRSRCLSVPIALSILVRRGRLLTAGSNRQRCGSPGKNDGRGSRRRFPCADISGQS